MRVSLRVQEFGLVAAQVNYVDKGHRVGRIYLYLDSREELEEFEPAQECCLQNGAK